MFSACDLLRVEEERGKHNQGKASRQDIKDSQSIYKNTHIPVSVDARSAHFSCETNARRKKTDTSSIRLQLALANNLRSYQCEQMTEKE